jgi:hypothetical protein
MNDIYIKNPHFTDLLEDMILDERYRSQLEYLYATQKRRIYVLSGYVAYFLEWTAIQRDNRERVMILNDESWRFNPLKELYKVYSFLFDSEVSSLVKDSIKVESEMSSDLILPTPNITDLQWDYVEYIDFVMDGLKYLNYPFDPVEVLASFVWPMRPVLR